MKHSAAAATLLALFVSPALAADMPQELNPQPLPPIAEDAARLNPQPLPPIAEEAMEVSGDLNPQPLPPIEAAEPVVVIEEVDARVRITNGTGAPIAELFSARAGGGNWQPILGGRSVSPGASVTVDFENSANLCEFDLRAVFSDGTDQLVRDLDACTIGALTFTG